MHNDSDKNIKGFSGLSCLVSDISDIDELIKMEPKSDAKFVGKWTTENPENKWESDSRISRMCYIWGLGALGILIFVMSLSTIGQSPRTSNPPPPPQSQSVPVSTPAVVVKPPSASQSSSTPTSTPPKPLQNAPVSTPQKTELEYTKPPVGTDNLLSLSEIRWCVREGIRIEAMRDVVDTNEGIDKFNRIVDDYNRRAGSYRYRQGTKAQATLDVEEYRSQIVAEAILEAKQWGRPTRQPPMSSTPELKSSPIVKEAQQILTNIGYDPGPIDGEYGRRTANAVKEFQRDAGLAENGLIDLSLLNKLRSSEPRITIE